MCFLAGGFEQSGSAVAYATPFDEEIAELAAQLDATIESESAAKHPVPPLTQKKEDSGSGQDVVLTEAYLRSIFNTVDKDGSGEINKRELIIALRNDAKVAQALRLPARIRQEDGTRDSFEAVFQAIDASDDNLVSWAEFLRYFEREGRVAREQQQKATTEAPARPASGPSSPSSQRLLSRTSSTTRQIAESLSKPEKLSPRSEKQFREEAAIALAQSNAMPIVDEADIAEFDAKMRHRPFLEASTGTLKDLESLNRSVDFDVCGEAPARYNHNLVNVVDTLLDASAYFEVSMKDQLASYGIDPNALWAKLLQHAI